MNLGIRNINDYLTFQCNTHAADTGSATDADSAPIYRIYEDETATPLLTGSLAKLDDANTTGFYTERVQLTAANGFEVGKSYTIYIEATVGSITGTMSHTFQVTALNMNEAILEDLLNGGRLDLLIDAIKAKTDSLTFTQAGHVDANVLKFRSIDCPVGPF